MRNAEHDDVNKQGVAKQTGTRTSRKSITTKWKEKKC